MKAIKSICLTVSLMFISGCSQESMESFTKTLEGASSVLDTVEDYKSKRAQRKYIERQQ